MGKIYEYRITLTLGDTNLLGTAYYTNVFHWQGACRELWVNDCVEGGIGVFRNGTLITASASNTYIKDLNLFDKVLVQMQVTRIGNTSADLRFRVFNEKTMKLAAEGAQTIVYGGLDHKPAPLPPEIVKAASEYFDDSESPDTGKSKKK